MPGSPKCFDAMSALPLTGYYYSFFSRIKNPVPQAAAQGIHRLGTGKTRPRRGALLILTGVDRRYWDEMR